MTDETRSLNSPKHQARDDDLLFSHYLQELVGLAHDAMAEQIPIPRADHLGFMIWGFCAKMTYHAESLLALRDRNKERDMAPVARTMIEGLGHLDWALEDRESRPELWRAFAAVEDYRLAQRKIAAGEEVSAELRDQIAEYLTKYGPRFLKTRKTQMPKLFTPGSEDCFRIDWVPPKHSQSWKKMPDIIELQDHFHGAYSRWLHWNVASFAEMLHRGDGVVSIVSESPDERVAALVIGCKCTRQVLIRLDKHFELALDEALEAVDRECLGDRLNGVTGIVRD